MKALTLEYITEQLKKAKEIKSINIPGKYHLDKDRKIKHWETVLRKFKHDNQIE